jgi:carbon starvation protein CstA
MYGPMAYIWIVAGNIFMGAVHDYFSGMLSVRNNGASLPELVGKYLGNGFRQTLRVFTLLLLIMVGVAFVNGPADLLNSYTGVDFKIWLYIIFTYYLIATLLPINKIIGKIYPFFGVALILMALFIGGYMLINGLGGTFHLHELSFADFRNLHTNPKQNLLYPMIFIVISCGAISGFHSTQSPMMARCMTKESQGRYVFYGAMVTEGIVAIIWATAAMNFFKDTNGLNEIVLLGKNPAWIVKEISQTWFGVVGTFITIIGVIAAPITTGDTAFRSARLIIADALKVKQASISKRLWVSIPLFVVGYVLTQIDFSTIWKFLGLFNQLLSVIMLWTAAMYLKKVNKFHWLLSLPATFMTAVTVTYLLVAPNKTGGLAINPQWGYIAGAVFAVGALLIFILKTKNTDKE